MEDLTLEVDEEFQQEFITAIDHLGALWHVDFFADGDDEPASVDFEDLPVGFIHSGVYEQDGFVFANVPGDRGLPTDPLRVDDESQGYESTVLTVFNWARRLDVRRADGSPFSLERFDYAAGRWTEPGDFVLTGHFSDGSTDTRVVEFDSRAMDDVVSFDLNFAGGVNNAYGAVDNFVFA